MRDGATTIGWKVGYGSQQSRSRLSLDAPLVGFLTNRSLLDSGSSCSLTGWASPMLELEVAVHINIRVTHDLDPLGLEAAIGGLSAAVELVDLDVGDVDVAHILATNIFHRRVILAPNASWQGSRTLAGLGGKVVLNGVVVATTDDLEANGKIVKIVEEVSVELNKCGETLDGGSIVICGAVVPPIFVAPGDDVLATIDELGSVRVSFT